MKAKVEMIGKGHKEIRLLGKRIFPKTSDTLYISNRKPNLWIFSLFNGYKQLGIFETRGKFKEGDNIIVNIKKGKIVDVKIDKLHRSC